MSAQLEPRSWTEAQVREEARAAGFESVESALVSFLHGHGGRAGSLWAAFVSSRCRPAPPADAPPPSARPGPIRLCLGGTKPAPGWTIVNALPLPGVDVVSDAGDLRAWADGSVEEVGLPPQTRLVWSCVRAAPTYIRTQLARARALSLSCSPSLSRALALSRARALSLSLSLSHTHTHTHTHVHTQVYMSHTLEHIDYMDALQPALREVARVIKPGGVFRCSVPDLAILCQMFVQLQDDDESSAGAQSWRLRCGNHTQEWMSGAFQHPGIRDPVLPAMKMQVMRIGLGGQMADGRWSFVFGRWQMVFLPLSDDMRTCR
jgi:predicted SAM-dependent methyltransferase